MKMIKVAESTNLQLDWLVWMAEGGFNLKMIETYDTPLAWEFSLRDEDDRYRIDRLYLTNHSPSSDPLMSYPIIERERITISQGRDIMASIWFPGALSSDWFRFKQRGPTPLIAAMRCYAVSKLGEVVEVPSEL